MFQRERENDSDFGRINKYRKRVMVFRYLMGKCLARRLAMEDKTSYKS